MNADGLPPPELALPLPPAELQRRIRQAIATLRLEGFTVPDQVHERVRHELRNRNQLDYRGAIACVQAKR